MVQKEFCDRCGKDISFEDEKQNRAEISYKSLGRIDSYVIDSYVIVVCGACAAEFKLLLKPTQDFHDPTKHRAVLERIEK